MEETSRKDIRRILKTFGIAADEALVAFLARNPNISTLRVKITLEDVSDYGGNEPSLPLRLVVEDEIKRAS